jgi:hypothetical protein
VAKHTENRITCPTPELKARGGLFIGGDQESDYNVFITFNHLLLHHVTAPGACQSGSSTCRRLWASLRSVVFLGPPATLSDRLRSVAAQGLHPMASDVAVEPSSCGMRGTLSPYKMEMHTCLQTKVPWTPFVTSGSTRGTSTSPSCDAFGSPPTWHSTPIRYPSSRI